MFRFGSLAPMKPATTTSASAATPAVFSAAASHVWDSNLPMKVPESSQRAAAKRFAPSRANAASMTKVRATVSAPPTMNSHTGTGSS